MVLFNKQGVIVPAGTTAGSTNVLSCTGARGIELIINVTAVTAGTVTVAINGLSAEGIAYPILTSAALGAVATTVLRVEPGLAPVANLTANDEVPDEIQVVITVTGTITFSVDYTLDQ